MLMYGSSFRMQTGMPRALRMRPMEAAVMPLPSEEVTPPVTKTYFGIGLPRTSLAQAGGGWTHDEPRASSFALSTREAIIPHASAARRRFHGSRSRRSYSSEPSADPVTAIGSESASCW